MKPMNVVFDLDGTLSDVEHRLHYLEGGSKDWDAFFEACDKDPPIVEMCNLARVLMVHHTVEIWTGRYERVREKTEYWLHNQFGRSWQTLRMRANGDKRHDHVVKAEFLVHFTPDIIFEDRTQVVDMWRSKGIRVCQVAPGDF